MRRDSRSTTPKQLSDRLLDFRPDDVVTLTVLRDGKERAVRVRLGGATERRERMTTSLPELCEALARRLRERVLPELGSHAGRVARRRWAPAAT